MRISTNSIYQSGINKITQLQSDQVKLQQQISTGRRISSPSDDPVAAASSLSISHAQGINDKFADTRKTAELKLNTLESNLTTVTDMLVSVHSSLVAAGNAIVPLQNLFYKFEHDRFANLSYSLNLVYSDDVPLDSSL